MTAVFISTPQTPRMRELAHSCASHLTSRGVRVLGEIDVTSSDRWDAQLLLLIRQADVVLVFLEYPMASTGVELGYALGAQKQVVLIADSFAQIPAVLADVQILPITSDREELLAKIEKVVSQLAMANRHQEWTTKNVREFAMVCRADPGILEQVSYEQFEAFVKDAFDALGYSPALPPKGFDVDFVLNSFEGPHRVAVEVKKWPRSRKIPVGAVQQFLGSLFGQAVESGLFLSTAEFTDSARDFALRTEGKVRLWNFEDLANRLEKDPRVTSAVTKRTDQ